MVKADFSGQWVKTHKVLTLIIGLLVLQVPWYVVIQLYANKTQVKTTATVIRLDKAAADCTGDRRGRPDPTCDHSDRVFPVYEYFDQSGHRYEQDDQYFGEYKENNPLGFLRKDVGDKVPAYYTKDKPQEVLFMASPYAYTAWLVPLYIASITAAVYGAVIAISKGRQLYRQHFHQHT
jgi:hypothetical protein